MIGIRLGQLPGQFARGLSACRSPSRRGMRPVHVGKVGGFHYGPTTASVPAGHVAGCDGDAPLVALSPDTCPPPPKVDAGQVATIAQGVARGLADAPLISTQPAPWVDPNYRGMRFPQVGLRVLTTFGAADVRTVQARNALAGYLTTANQPITAVAATAGQAVEVFSFQCQDTYRGEEFHVVCQDQEILYLTKWGVTLNGHFKAGPHSLRDGRMRMNVQAKWGETVAIVAVLTANDAFAVGLEIYVEGWLYPVTLSTDGTYSKVLRASPSWPKGD